MCCAHFNSHPVTTSTALRPTPLHNPDSVTLARPVKTHACAPPTANHFGTTAIKMRYTRRAAHFRRANSKVGSIPFDPYRLIHTVRARIARPIRSSTICKQRFRSRDLSRITNGPRFYEPGPCKTSRIQSLCSPLPGFGHSGVRPLGR